MKDDIFGEMTASLAANSYHSKFDFGSYEISETDKNFIIQREEIIADNFKTYSKSTYEICKALYEVSITLKADGSFMAWYTCNNLTKDKVSELLKRYELYLLAPGMEDYISALSGLAVKLLTNKNIDEDTLLSVLELKVSNCDEIKQLIYKSDGEEMKEDKSPKIKTIPFNNKFSFKVYTDFEKRIKKAQDLKDLVQCKIEIKDLKKALAELEAEISTKEKLGENKNNLTFDDIIPDIIPTFQNLAGWIYTIIGSQGNYEVVFFTSSLEFEKKNPEKMLNIFRNEKFNTYKEAEIMLEKYAKEHNLRRI